MNEMKNPNNPGTAKPDLGQSHPQESGSEPASKEKGDEYLFYNVMPPANGGSIVPPTLKTTTTEIPSLLAKPASPTLKSGNLMWIVLAIAAVIISVGGYFGYNYYVNKQLEKDSLLINENSGENKEQEASTTPEGYKKEWLVKYFQREACDQENLCGRESDPDLDGLYNIDEFNLKTDPNNPDSDQDGLADGDEKHVFSSDAMNKNSAGDATYNDADFLKGAYSLKNVGEKMTAEEIEALGASMREIGLHQPTLATLKDALEKIYNFKIEVQQPSVGTSTPVSNLDQSPAAKLDRDMQRSLTMKNISLLLLKYYDDNKYYPQTESFPDMMQAVKPYIRVATSQADPINKDPYVYGYLVQNNGADFTLSYYSESQNTLIKLHADDAVKARSQDTALNYDDQRKNDLDMIRSALLLYSAAHVTVEQDYVFPTKAKLKTALVPAYLSSVPKDPETGAEYTYEVATNLASFTLKSKLSNPPAGSTGWICSQDECTTY